MKILIADPDRDFLSAFSALLRTHDHTVTTVFDGAQVITKLSAHRYDLVLLNENIPRVPIAELLTMTGQMEIPSIIVAERNIRSEMLMQPVIGTAYLSLPFLPEELLTLIRSIFAKRERGNALIFEDVQMLPASFRMCGQLPVTNGEIDLFEALLKKESIDSKRAGPYIASLNGKLQKLHKKTRIRYLMNVGYRLVTNSYE